MNHFSELRKLARDKRDEAIQAARTVYQNELDSINSLEKKLNRKPSLKGRPKPKTPMHVEIMNVVPTDANFTVVELLGWLGLPDSEKARVRTIIDRLMRHHQLKRVRRGRRDRPALFSVMDFGPPLNPLNDMSQLDAAAAVLRDVGRPLSLTDLIMELKERGYVPINGDRALVKSLGREMGRKDEFYKEGGKWSRFP